MELCIDRLSHGANVTKQAIDMSLRLTLTHNVCDVRTAKLVRQPFGTFLSLSKLLGLQLETARAP